MSLTTLITMPHLQFVQTPEGSADSCGVTPMSADAFTAASAEELASRLLGVAVSVSTRIEEDVQAPCFDRARGELKALAQALDEVVMGMAPPAAKSALAVVSNWDDPFDMEA